MRQENIEKIIRQREPLANRVMTAQTHLAAAMDQFEKFHILCRSTLQDKVIAEEFGDVRQILEDTDRLTLETRKRQDELAHLYKRLTRNTLNIAVIGRARQGKSRLLQTITGLSAEEIPDGNQAFCTGVRSDIINTDTDITYASVNFMTEEHFLKESIAPYFADLRKYVPDLLSPTSLSEFKNLSLPDPETLRTDPKDKTLMNLHLKHLEDLQSHLSQYAELFGQRPRQIKKEEIRQYVAQDDEEGNRIYFNHLAVDSVEIFCRFPNADVGALRLIDLPGLGDTRIGDVERVVNALRDQVDLVFFLSKPSNTGAGWQDIDVNLYSEARSALGDKLPIDHWAFWVFNHDSRPGADNATQCEYLRGSMSSAQINVANTAIVDCTNTEDVSKNLLDVALEHLSRSIEQNDRRYAENLQGMLKATMQDMRELMEKTRESLKEEGDSDRDSETFDLLFAELWNNLREEMQDCVEEDSELRKNRDEPCKELQDKIKAVLDEEESGELQVTVEDLKKVSKRKGGLGTAYDEALNYLRTRLSQRLQESLDTILDDVLQNMKNKFCSILAKTGRLEGRFGVSDYRLLGEMINFIETSGYSKDMPTLVKGLTLLDGWTMSYRSFIQHRLRSALNGLDPLDVECKQKGAPTTEEQAVEILGGAYKETIYKVRQALDGIYSEPNKAAFAVAEEFKDIMIRSNEMQGRDMKLNLDIQWRRFYRSIRGNVWQEEYGSSQRRRDVNAKLRTPLDGLLPLLAEANFEFLE